MIQRKIGQIATVTIALAVSAFGQLVTVSESAYPSAVGSGLWKGTIAIDMPLACKLARGGQSFGQGSRKLCVGVTDLTCDSLFSAGQFSIDLLPTVTGTSPAGCFYAVSWRPQGNATSSAIWTVPASGPVHVADVQTAGTVTPSSAIPLSRIQGGSSDGCLSTTGGAVSTVSCGSGGGGGTWGSITGTLSSQTDLASALAGKQTNLGFVPLNPANNLSDIASATTARSNLGLGSPGNYPTLNQNTTGTASALSSSPTQCTPGKNPTGIIANGNATGCDFPYGATLIAANIVLAGPTSGGSSAPSFRSLVEADLPATAAKVIASGASALGTSSISSGACATVVTTTATGVVSTDAIVWNPNASIKGVTGYIPASTGGLSIAGYPAADSVNWDVCNWTSLSMTPGAVTLNWRVVR